MLPFVAWEASGQGVGPRPLFGARGPLSAHPAGPATPPTIIPAGSAAPAPTKSVLDFVHEKHREAVAAVMKNPTMTAKANDDEFQAHAKVYDWLIEHPDRTALAWQRLKVPCVDITDLGKGQFFWSDDNGSELTWQTVGRFENGVIWYATGKVKAGTLIPSTPVKAVAVLQSPRSEADKIGVVTFKPTVSIYLMSDSRVANMVLKVAGPAAPKMAEQGAEQLLYFFSGIARHLYKKPEQIEAVLAPKK
jgi:hypothetical protein